MPTCRLQSSATSSRAWQRSNVKRDGRRVTNATRPNLQETSKALRIWRVVDHSDGHEALEQQVRAPSGREASHCWPRMQAAVAGEWRNLLMMCWARAGASCGVISRTGRDGTAAMQPALRSRISNPRHWCSPGKTSSETSQERERAKRERRAPAKTRAAAAAGRQMSKRPLGRTLRGCKSRESGGGEGGDGRHTCRAPTAVFSASAAEADSATSSSIRNQLGVTCQLGPVHALHAGEIGQSQQRFHLQKPRCVNFTNGRPPPGAGGTHALCSTASAL
jgi:hypothetical protein